MNKQSLLSRRIEASKPMWSPDGQVFQQWAEAHNYYCNDLGKLVTMLNHSEITLAQAKARIEAQFGKNQ